MSAMAITSLDVHVVPALFRLSQIAMTQMNRPAVNSANASVSNAIDEEYQELEDEFVENQALLSEAHRAFDEYENGLSRARPP